MASEWETHTFEELIENGSLLIGDGYRAKNDELGGDGHIFLRAGQVTDTHIDLTGIERFHASLSDKVVGKMAQTRDVVITTKGNSTGRTTYITPDLPPLVYSPHLSFWRSINHNVIYPEFLRYWAQGPQFQGQLEGFKVSTDMAPYLSLTDQKRLHITLPLPEEQRTIAEILSPLDDKIEINRRMNATLEAMAQALFKSWFVDFDPVKARAEGRAPEGMDAEAAALFPSEFEESELGSIPKGWQCQSLGEAFEVNPTRRLGKGQEANYLDMANVSIQGHRPVSWANRSFSSGTKFINGDTLLARITPCLENGKTAFVDFLPAGETGWGSTEFIVLRPKLPLPEYFGYLLCREPNFRAFAIQSMTGTSGRQRVQTDLLGKYLLVRPSGEIAGRFGEVIASLVSKISRNSEETNSLAAIRDALLPRLISGQLRIPEVEKMAEAVR